MQTSQTNQNKIRLGHCIGHERGRSTVAGMIMKMCSMVALVAFMVGIPCMAASVAFQAESGTLGANFLIGSTNGAFYIRTTSNNTGGNPGIPGRVASYSVTFPSAGTYDLFARVWVGSGAANDDSFFYGNGFGSKTVTSDADWILVNSIDVGGYTNSSQVVTNSGSAGVTVWKWINLSDYTGAAGETPISFTVTAANLTQTFQIGTREDGLLIDAFVFGSSSNFTVANLDAAVIPPLPASPTSLFASGGNAVVNLTWVQSTSPGITSNKVSRSTTGNGGPYSLRASLSATTSYADTSVVNGTQYFYVVTAINANGESGFSAYSGATPMLPIPNAPTGLTPTAGNGQVSLSWTASSGATSYNVKRSTTSGGPYTTITNVTATSFINTGLVNGTTYFYVVSALNSSGESANSSQVSATPNGSPPAVPTGLTPTAGNGQVSLTWNTSSGATSYNVKRSTTSGGPYTTITNVTATSFINTGLVNGTTYFYVVSALNANGESANSSQVSATPSGTSTPPLVYTVENTGSGFPAPPLPTEANLPIILPLTDPFMWSTTNPTNWSNPTGRSTAFTDWSQRRSQIKAEIENYEIGFKPPVSSAMIFASVSGSGTSRTLTVRVTNIVSGTPRTLTLTSAIGLPGSSGTFPAIIGMNSPNGSISLGGRAIATITYSHDQVTTYNNPQNSNPYYALYAAPYSPALNIDNTGQYSAWAWGVSRIIDGLYKLNGNLGGGVTLNLQRIGVTGCSYAGKMALFAGALDERIALTIPQESGGGGAPNWRYSWQNEPNGTVEGLGQTSHQWFKESMFDFAGADTAKLPHDHHELMMMVAPRALFATGNPDGAVWLSNPSCYVSCKAVEQVYNTWGIVDRFGYNINGGKSHCATTAELNADVGAFLDKFLLGNTSANTMIRDFPSSYSSIDFARWTAWWGTTNPVFPGAGASYTQTYEPECATVGSLWQIISDAAASNGKYVTITPGLNSTASAPAASTGWVTIPFSVTNTGTYFVTGRVNGPDANGDSFWVRMDGGAWTSLNGLPVGGWAWASFGSFSLTAGSHSLTIGYREDGAQLDKISVSDSSFAPTGTGPTAAILCP